jgi:outer membrane protein insertion porin family
MKKLLRVLALASLASVIVVARAGAQVPQAPAPAAAPVPAPPATSDAPAQSFGPPATVCGTEVPPPIAQPPANSGPVVYLAAPCFEAQGNITLIEPETYAFYIRLPTSRPSQGVWVPWTDTAEEAVHQDFLRLWGTGFLDDLKVESTDYRFANGVVGKIITYHIEERERVKIVDYIGTKKIEAAKIDERLRTAKSEIRTDSFIDDATVKKVEGLLRDMLKEKGFPYAEVTHSIANMPGGPKLVHLTFNLSEGPEVKIRTIDFVGNQAIQDGKLRKQMKNNKQGGGLFSMFTSAGTYHADKIEEDIERVTEFYRNEGYVRANLGEPEVRTVEDTPDKKTRWIELRIPVTENSRYRLGELTFDGNKVLRSDGLRTLFKIQEGDYYSNKKIAEGYKKLKDTYGVGGYWDLNGYPDFKFSDMPDPAAPAVPAALAAEAPGKADPVVDVTLRLTEGTQYFVNRITFTGNTTTYDNVVRREMQLLENSVFNTEALKNSVRRINQLGYFRALDENRDVTLEKTPNAETKVDVQLHLEEQNRNQINFGAGISQYEGFFGQLSFQTANFLGRGETLTLSLQSGSRANNYQIGFTEPFLFERNITGGANIFKSEVRYVGQYTQSSRGAVLTLGLPVGRGFTRFYTNYSYEQVHVTEINPNILTNTTAAQRNIFLRDQLLLENGGERIISKITPTLVHNTVDQPIFPTTGKRLTASLALAGLGGNVNYYKPSLEGIWFWRQTNRWTFGVRGQLNYINTRMNPLEIPIYERLFLGGEYDVRGFDLRTIGPTDPYTGLVQGGNKSVLFNVEQSFSIAPQVRLIGFFDAGQVRDFGDPFTWKETITEVLPVDPPLLIDPYAPPIGVTDPNAVPATRSYQALAFKASTGGEVRFFMPVLNVPFRLIFAYNPSRAGVLDNTLRPQSAFQFRFAVGTTF